MPAFALVASVLAAAARAAELRGNSTEGVTFTRRHSVSGVSSGGGMAVDHLVAFSAIVDGGGVVAGNPFGCGSLADFDNACNYNEPAINVEALFKYTEARQAAGAIDPIRHLAEMPVYIYHGTEDTIVYQPVGFKTAKFFERYVNPEMLLTEFRVPSEHGLITDGYGECCNCIYGTFILDCQYDQAGVVLQHIYGRLEPKVSKAPRRHFHTISQRKYMPDGWRWGQLQLEDTAFVYVPPRCRGRMQSCRVHVNYHGCGGGGAIDAPIHGGYAEWAEANDIVVLYPQASWGLGNLGGCWDWWGVTGPGFDTKLGGQLLVVLAMIEDLDKLFASESETIARRPAG